MRKLFINSMRSRRKRPIDGFKVFIFSDNHLRAGVDSDPNDENAIEGNRYFYASNAKLRHFVDIVNSEQPDLVLHLGDMADTPEDFAYFNQKWSEISVAKEVMIGNHDFDDLNYQEIVDVLGYQNSPYLAGSHFNKSFVVGDARFIMLDTNFVNGEHAYTSRGRLKDDSVLDWLETEIANAQENNIFLCTHQGAHNFHQPNPDVWTYFEEEDAMKIKNVIDSVGKKVVGLFGHYHTRNIVEYNNLGKNFPGYRLPDAVEFETGHFTELTISDSGINLTRRTLNYPYP